MIDKTKQELLDKANGLQTKINVLQKQHSEIMHELVDEYHHKGDDFSGDDINNVVYIFENLKECIDKFFLVQLLKKIKPDYFN